MDSLLLYKWNLLEKETDKSVFNKNEVRLNNYS